MASQAEKERFYKAFVQYTQGCPRQFCLNPQCARSSAPRETDLNKAAAKLLELFASDQRKFVYCPELPHLASTAYANFFDFNLLGSAFVSAEGTSHRIDFGQVTKAYEELNELIGNDSLAKDWMSSSIAKFGLTPYSLLHFPRIVLILLSNPALYDPDVYSSLQNLAELVSKTPEIYTSLSALCDDISAELARQIVQVLQQYLTIKFCEVSKPSDLANVERGIKLIECLQSSNRRVPRISPVEFYNDAANKDQNMANHYKAWLDIRETRRHRFTLVNYPWILNASSKSKLLACESMSQMRDEMFDSMMYGRISGEVPMPYFVLSVNRSNLLEGTLGALVSGDNNLKMQLKVHFEGEDGVDEGGVKKEFFQLIIKELFDPIYSMFNYYPETRLYWFNPRTLESSINFELIGIVLGLAIYNGVILNVSFPAAIYKKLLKAPTSIQDLEMVNPVLVKGFQQLLAFEGDVESTYCRNFTAETLAFDQTERHELKPRGSEIALTNDNREEYVDLYVDWFLNKSVDSLFSSFYRGFWKVCGGEILQTFTPEELELMICGNPELNFYELQRTTRYESGYTENSAVVVWFWELVHAYDLEHKKKFLTFATGSDRAPIEGLGSLKMKILRNGPDSDRLMTASTCFNYLLLPEYSSKEKLSKLLDLAIQNSEGFGLR